MPGRLMWALRAAVVAASLGAGAVATCPSPGPDAASMVQLSVQVAAASTQTQADLGLKPVVRADVRQRAAALQKLVMEVEHLRMASGALLGPALGVEPACGNATEQTEALDALAEAVAGIRAGLERLPLASAACYSRRRPKPGGAMGPGAVPRWAGPLMDAGGSRHECSPGGSFGMKHVGCTVPAHEQAAPASQAFIPGQPIAWSRWSLASLPMSDFLQPGPNATDGLLPQTPGLNKTVNGTVNPWDLPIPSGSTTPSVPKASSWLLLLNLLLIVASFATIMLMIVYCSPFRGAHFDANERTGDIASSRGITGHLVQVCMPYWLPTTSESTGRLFVHLFLALNASAAGLGLLFLNFKMHLVTWSSSSIFDSFIGTEFSPVRWFSWRTTTWSCALAMVFPVAYLPCRSQLRGRGLQWSLLAFKLFVLYEGNLSKVPFSYVGRGLNNWMIKRDADAFWHYWRFCQIFQWLISIAFAVLSVLVDKALEIKWRRFMTNHIMDRYMAKRSYYLLNSNSGQDQFADNPDARIQQDVTDMLFSIIRFILSIIELAFGMVNCIMIVWMIVPYWTMIAVGYTMMGSGIALWFTWQFTRLGYELQKKEADWRFSLVNIRLNAEPIAFYGGERAERMRVDWRFEAIQEFSVRALKWNLGYALYHEIYSLTITAVPSIILTRMYFQDKLDFGGMMQFQTAFSMLVGHLTYILNRTDLISSVATSVTRLGGMLERIEKMSTEGGIQVMECPAGERLDVRNLTVRTPDAKVELISNLSFTMGGKGEPLRVLIMGRSGIGKSSVMRAIAGLWIDGSGQVERPPSRDCMFLPQQPYMCLGTLRDQLCYPDVQSFTSADAAGRDYTGDKGRSKTPAITDDDLRRILEDMNLGHLPKRFSDGFEHIDDWSRLLSRGEQQRVAVARCLTQDPALTVLDEATSALSRVDEDCIYNRLHGLGRPYLSVAHRPSLVRFHDAVLELEGSTGYRIYSSGDYMKLLKQREAEGK